MPVIDKVSMEVLAKRVQRLLRRLGRTRGQVAATLRRCAIQGYREDSERCPVANWLNQRLAADDTLCTVHHDCIDLWRRPIGEITHAEVSMPKPVRAFIHAFDKEERYPSLEQW